MNDKPIEWELDFDDTKLKELEKKLFSGGNGYGKTTDQET